MFRLTGGEQTATAERCANDVDLLEQYHSYQFFLDDTSQEWKELRVGLCGDEDPRSPFWRLDRFGAAGLRCVANARMLDGDAARGEPTYAQKLAYPTARMLYAKIAASGLPRFV